MRYGFMDNTYFVAKAMRNEYMPTLSAVNVSAEIYYTIDAYGISLYLEGIKTKNWYYGSDLVQCYFWDIPEVKLGYSSKQYLMDIFKLHTIDN